MTADLEQLSSWPDLPEGIEAADGVDLDMPDPTVVMVETAQGPQPKRQCIARRSRDAARCQSAPVTDSLLCAAHAGLLDASAGGRATAEMRRKARESAEERVAARRLGIRAQIAETLQRKSEQVDTALSLLIDDAADTSLAPQQRRQAALAVLPYLDQALGKPTERVEHSGGLEDVAQLSTAELAARVAAGRAQRLHAVPSDAA